MENKTEKYIKEELNAITPLEGGIVFGKEEAWERLQGMLEQKKERKLLPLMKWAVAATLVLMVVALGYQFYAPTHVVPTPESNIAVAPNSLPQQVHAAHDIINTNENKQTAPENKTPENHPHKSAPLAVGRLATPTTAHINTQTEQIAPLVRTLTTNPPITPQPQHEVNNDKPQPTENNTQPTAEINPPKQTKQRMKVIHINEIEAETGNAAMAANKPMELLPEVAPSLASRHRTVVHINEVMKEEQEERLMPRENRMFGNFVFIKSPGSTFLPAYGLYNTYAHKIFKINIYGQN